MPNPDIEPNAKVCANCEFWQDYRDRVMEIPGIKAAHMEITENCRKVQGGDEEAFDEAVSRMKAEYMKLLPSWPVGKKAKFHLILSVEYPR